MGFRLKRDKPSREAVSVQTGRDAGSRFWLLEEYVPLARWDLRLYEAIREAVPLVDAAITKIVRLTGGFKVSCPNREAGQGLERFLREVRVGASNRGLETFMDIYLDNLLTYGNAVGEIVLTKDKRQIAGLYNADPAGEDSAGRPSVRAKGRGGKAGKVSPACDVHGAESGAGAGDGGFNLKGASLCDVGAA